MQKLEMSSLFIASILIASIIVIFSMLTSCNGGSAIPREGSCVKSFDHGSFTDWYCMAGYTEQECDEHAAGVTSWHDGDCSSAGYPQDCGGGIWRTSSDTCN